MTLSRTDQINNSINKNQNNEIARLFPKETDKQNNDFKDERICYNYNEKRHITRKCVTLKQENSQINVIKNFQQNIQTDVEKTPLIRLIIKVFDESKN